MARIAISLYTLSHNLVPHEVGGLGGGMSLFLSNIVGQQYLYQDNQAVGGGGGVNWIPPPSSIAALVVWKL